MSLFWETTKKIMYTKNISQADISRYLNKPLSTVNRWHNNDIIPSADFALQIADLLEVDIRYLITGKSLESEDREVREILSKPELKKTLDVLKTLSEEDLAKFRAAFQAIAALSAEGESRIVGGNAG